MLVSQAIEAVLAHTTVAEDSSKGFVDGFEVKESKYAKELIQLDNGKKISPNPKDWKCEATGATKNLWLNLSDGYIGDGRAQYGSDVVVQAALSSISMRLTVYIHWQLNLGQSRQQRLMCFRMRLMKMTWSLIHSCLSI
eukprot:TRINITY_DN760_c0_g1_i1.p1 TRINITY_DN760_c0_g1~~TRINITY_DN760_c0_g1_i1.p1  ORF type:complete len:139 (-),score=13.21 TRINITY_DN760_c0_g1_i1:406-822(-)